MIEALPNELAADLSAHWTASAWYWGVSSEELARAVAQALKDEVVEVIDLGLSGTEEMYFATSQFEADGGICISASHDPTNWNGICIR